MLFSPCRVAFGLLKLSCLSIEEKGVEAGGLLSGTSKATKPPLPSVGGLRPCPVSMWQSQVPCTAPTPHTLGGRGGVEAGIGSSCLEWKQTPTPSQTQIEIPGGIGCPKQPRARLGQGGQTMNSGLWASRGLCGSQAYEN